MRRSDALYYPNVEPPLKWLRSAALFFDSVTSFVPQDAERSLSKDLCEFAEATKAWNPYRPTENTALLFDLPANDLDKAFEAIASARQSAPGQIVFEIGPESIHVGDHVFMHGSKLSQPLRDRLAAHGLLLSKELADGFMGGDWWLVNQQASDLVLAYIADRLAALKGWTSLTDSEICYLFTAASSSDISPSPNIAENHLARVIVTELVPDVIDMLSLDKYCELRARYEPIRERLAIFMNEVVVENRLGQIGDPGELSGAVHDCIKDLKTEILSFRESTFGKAFRKWGPFSLGSLISLATPIAHLDPTWTIPLAGASLLVRAVDKAGFLEHKVTNRTEMVRLLASARTDIISSLDIKRFLVA